MKWFSTAGELPFGCDHVNDLSCDVTCLCTGFECFRYDSLRVYTELGQVSKLVFIVDHTVHNFTDRLTTEPYCVMCT